MSGGLKCCNELARKIVSCIAVVSRISFRILKPQRKVNGMFATLLLHVRNLSSSLCNTTGKALYASERRVMMLCSVPDMSNGFIMYHVINKPFTNEETHS